MTFRKIIDNDKKVCLFLPSLFGGGAERIMVNLAQGLSDLGVPVDIVLASARGPLRAEVPPKVRIVDLHARSVLASILPLAKYFRKERPDVVLSALENANIAVLLARRLARVRMRVVITIHCVLSRWISEGRSLKRWFFQTLVPRCYPWADALVAVSRGAAADASNVTGIPGSRIKVVYNPVVDSGLLAKATPPPDHPWLQAGQPKVILAVGNLSPWKDHGALIRAFSIVRRLRPVRLMILGEGGERPRLESLVRELGLGGDVSLPGFVDNPYPYMANAAVLVLSSQWEALPTVLIEGMAMGVPIVSTDCDYGPREILSGGKYGRLVPVGDTESLAEAIGQAISAGSQVLPPEALAPFRFDTSVERYLDILFGDILLGDILFGENRA